MYQTACFIVPPVQTEEAKHFWAYANLTAKSFKRETPDVRNILLTTKAAKIPRRLAFDTVQRLAEDIRMDKGLMVDECQGWLEFVRSELFNRPTILIDPDLILQKDPIHVFAEDFDVGLTWRVPTADPTSGEPFVIGAAQPINAGVIFLNSERKAAVVNFFKRCLDDLMTLPADYWKWYGDQESLLRVTGVNSFEQFEQIITTPDGTRIKFFHCRDYNHTPDSDPAGRPILTYAPDPYIVHFKGLSKRIMFQYAEQFIGMRFQHDRKAPGGVRIFQGR